MARGYTSEDDIGFPLFGGQDDPADPVSVEDYELEALMDELDSVDTQFLKFLEKEARR